MTDKKTRVAVAAMMKENTGASMCDSGGIYGRRYEILADVELNAQPKASIANHGYMRSMYHHLVDNLIINEKATEQLMAYANKEEYQNTYWETILQDYTREHKYNVTYAGNTCNFENALDGNFVWYSFEDEDGEEGVIIRTHNGCDLRAGYSSPMIFHYRSGFKDDSELTLIGSGFMYCENNHEHRYETYTGYKWLDSDDGVTDVEIGEGENGTLLCPKCNGILTAE